MHRPTGTGRQHLRRFRPLEEILERDQEILTSSGITSPVDRIDEVEREMSTDQLVRGGRPAASITDMMTLTG